MSELTQNLKQKLSKGKSLYREGMSPCVRSTSRPKWTRLPSQQCYYWRNDGGCYILSFTFKFDLEERYEFAYCYPYSYTELQNYLSSLAPELVERSIIGQTLQKRNMDLLSIGEGNRTIVVMARRVVSILNTVIEMAFILGVTRKLLEYHKADLQQILFFFIEP